jgi:hypothetical protein
VAAADPAWPRTVSHIDLRKELQEMGNTRIGQSSKFAPAVCFHGTAFHMVFVADDDTNQLLHAVSPDGVNWTRKRNVRQSTKQAPSIISVNGKLILVFVANNNTNTLLKCVYEDQSDDWSDNEPLGESSKAGPSLADVGGLKMYFIADNSTDDILETPIFVPQTLP